MINFIIPQFENHELPKFKLLEEVWIIEQIRSLSVVKKAQIISYQIEVIQNSDECISILQGYRLNRFNCNNYPSCIFSTHEVYKNKKHAERMAKFIPVNIAEHQWKLAIGDRGIVNCIEQSELGSCCAAISNARDILIKCHKNNGLIFRDIIKLRKIFKNECGAGVMEYGKITLSESQNPNLYKIYKQLEIGLKTDL